MGKKLNIRYSVSQFFYFAMNGTMIAFASVFLLDKGFANTTIGLTLSLASLSSIIFQLLIAKLVDKNKDWELQNMITVIVGVIFFASLLLLFLDRHFIILALVILSFSLSQAIVPLLNSVAFIYTDLGVQINYGFARGVGSLAYALVTVILGYIIELTSPQFLPAFYLIFGVMLVFSIQSYRLSEEEYQELDFKNYTRKIGKKKVDSDKTFFEFMKEYDKVVLLMLGIIFLFYGHIMINNFFIQIITPIGGTSKTLGVAIFIGTMLELPAMMNFNRLSQRIPVHNLLKIATVFFLIKHFLTFIAPNMTVIYLAQAAQIGAYSVAYPALVQYTQTVIADEDLVKGQSLLAISIGLSQIFASFTGGILLDQIGASKTMFVAVITTVIGLGIVFLTVENHSKEDLKQV